MSVRMSGWRLALRIARREALRAKRQTALMVALVGLPVLAVSAAAVAYSTSGVSPAERAKMRLGGAQALVSVYSGPLAVGPFPDLYYGEVDLLSDGAQKLALLGRRPTVEIVRFSARYDTDRGVDSADITQMDLGNELTRGLYRYVAGKRVPGRGEAVVNAPVAADGPGIGEQIVLRDGDRTRALTVVGISEDRAIRTGPIVVAGPGSFPGEWAGGSIRSWLLGGPAIGWGETQRAAAAGLHVLSRAVVDDPPPQSQWPTEFRDTDSVDPEGIAILVLVVVMVLLEVSLLAGPAFAVRARRQARSLALIAAAGGTPAQSRRVILATSLVVGGVAAVIGVVAGIGVGWLVLPALQAVSPNEYLGPFEVPWRWLAVVALFGVFAALLAAIVPAWIAARQDVVGVLAGRRGDRRPSARSPLVGVVLVAGAVGAAVAATRDSDAAAAPGFLAAAAALAVVGMIFLVPIVVVAVAALARRLPLALRFAARDAARHRTRTVPAVAAIAATVAGVVTVSIGIATEQASNRAGYVPVLGRTGEARVITDNMPVQTALTLAQKLLPADTITPMIGLSEQPPSENDDTFISLDVRPYTDTEKPFDGTELFATAAFGVRFLTGNELPAVVRASDAQRLAVRRALARGRVVLLAGRDTGRSGTQRLSISVTQESSDGTATIGRIKRQPAVWVRVGGRLPPVEGIVPSAVAKKLNVTPQPVALYIAGPVSKAAEEELTETLSARDEYVDIYVERGYQTEPETRIVQFVLIALGAVLMLGGTLTATLLALSDARPDLATMAAVGSPGRTRRAIAASYALVVGLVGALLGAAAGLIPGIALARLLTDGVGDGGITVPWAVLAIIVVELPLLTAAVMGICARSRLPLVARIE